MRGCYAGVVEGKVLSLSLETEEKGKNNSKIMCLDVTGNLKISLDIASGLNVCVK